MKSFVTVALCILYIISPVDFLPEILLGPLGLPDDVFAAITAFQAAFGKKA